MSSAPALLMRILARVSQERIRVLTPSEFRSSDADELDSIFGHGACEKMVLVRADGHAHVTDYCAMFVNYNGDYVAVVQ